MRRDTSAKPGRSRGASARGERRDSCGTPIVGSIAARACWLARCATRGHHIFSGKTYAKKRFLSLTYLARRGYSVLWLFPMVDIHAQTRQKPRHDLLDIYLSYP